MKKLIVCLVTGSFFSFFAQAQILPEYAKINPIKVLVSVIVKKGEGCTQATKRTQYPMKESECEKLLEQNKRMPYVDRRNPMMHIVLRKGVLHAGEQLHFIETPTGRGWVLVTLDDLRE